MSTSPEKYSRASFARERLRFYWSINWIKTLYFNFAKFPFDVACKLPVLFYGSVRFRDISADIKIDAPIKRGMIGFGQRYEIITRSKRIAELNLQGNLIFKGHVQFGIDYFVYIANGATLTMGHMASLGNNGKIICYQNIAFGNFARIGFESQIMDSTFHQMIDTKSGQKLPMMAPIENWELQLFGTPDFGHAEHQDARLLHGGVEFRLQQRLYSARSKHHDWRDSGKTAKNRNLARLGRRAGGFGKVAISLNIGYFCQNFRK